MMATLPSYEIRFSTRISDSRRRPQENGSSSLKWQWQPNGGFKKNKKKNKKKIFKSMSFLIEKKTNKQTNKQNKNKNKNKRCIRDFR